jgi:hypothetical protein
VQLDGPVTSGISWIHYLVPVRSRV